MLVTYIKYFFFFICSFYTLIKLLHIELSRKEIFLCLFAAFIFPFPIYYIKLYLPIITIIYMVTVFFISGIKIFNIPAIITFRVSIISLAFAYVVFLISALAITPLGIFISKHTNNHHISIIISHTLLGVLQLLMITIPFRLSRFKKGMPFLYQNDEGNVGTYICIIMLATTSFLSVRTKNDVLFAVLFILIAFSGIVIFIWWKKVIKQTYINKLRLREIEQLENIIKEQQTLLDKYKQEHDRLSEIIHKDNKLIPSYEMFVTELIQLYISNKFDDVGLNKARSLLDNLKTISQERKGIIKYSPTENTSSFHSDILQLDAIVNYLIRRASSYNIEINHVINADIHDMVKSTISVPDLCTIIADLVENAIIACKYSEHKNILISFDCKNDIFSLNIYDSGIPFTTDVLMKLGKARITTHSDIGGSGIGLMSSIELSRKYHGSFIITDELNNTYVKRVTVCFDNASKIQVETKEIQY